LVTIFVLFVFILIFCFIRKINKKLITQGQKMGETTPGLPVRLKIPSINVDAAIQYVGVNSKGEMEVPSNDTDVGWFKIGPRPGETGSAVIAGHFDTEKGTAGVFFNLYRLKAGDKLYVEDAKGKTISFVVRESNIYNTGYADAVFSRNDGTYLNLITCDGVWDGAKKSYNKRLVVFANIAN
jgi:LPXTG-site transpeptidase (sortase) family protein